MPEPEDHNQSSSIIIWEPISPKDATAIPPSDKESNASFIPPSNLKEAEAIFKNIPVQPSDFKPLLDISHAIPTASVLSQEDWRLISTTISHLNNTGGTGNQNYAIKLDYGLSDSLQISGFYSKADAPLNASIKGLQIRPENLWEVIGAAFRWKYLTRKNWSLALNTSLESWTVGSGGSNSRGGRSENNSSPNIFNESGTRVETHILLGQYLHH